MVSASAFSSGGITEEFAKEFPALHSTATEQLHLLWTACGTDGRLIDINRKFREWLASKDIKHVDIEAPGAHTWMVRHFRRCFSWRPIWKK